MVRGPSGQTGRFALNRVTMVARVGHVYAKTLFPVKDMSFVVARERIKKEKWRSRVENV